MKKERRKSCHSKVKYSTRKQAYSAMVRLLKKNFIFHRIKVYECKHCKSWHIGRTSEIIYDQFDRLLKNSNGK